jgi:hypothetical protein
LANPRPKILWHNVFDKKVVDFIEKCNTKVIDFDDENAKNTLSLGLIKI